MLRRSLRSTLFPYTTLFRSTAIAGFGGLIFGLGLLELIGPNIQIDYILNPSVDFNTALTTVFILIIAGAFAGLDRKSTRLNSSHVRISYAVFCLKKKTLEILRRTYADLPQVIAIARRAFPTPWSPAMCVLQLSMPTGACPAAPREWRLVAACAWS